jgi:hypothetical protein
LCKIVTKVSKIFLIYLNNIKIYRRKEKKKKLIKGTNDMLNDYSFPSIIPPLKKDII